MVTIYLRWLKTSKNVEGFTLIELLVVVIIIGILSAIALPSFLSQADRARQSEAKTNVATILRAEQAHFLENAEYIVDADDEPGLSKLGLGLKDTTNYKYTILAAEQPSLGVIAIAKPNENPTIKGYVGGVAIIYQDGSETPASQSALCESLKVGAPAQSLGTSNVVITPGVVGTGGGSVACGQNTIAVK